MGLRVTKISDGYIDVEAKEACGASIVVSNGRREVFVPVSPEKLAELVGLYSEIHEQRANEEPDNDDEPRVTTPRLQTGSIDDFRDQRENSPPGHRRYDLPTNVRTHTPTRPAPVKSNVVDLGDGATFEPRDRLPQLEGTSEDEPSELVDDDTGAMSV